MNEQGCPAVTWGNHPSPIWSFSAPPRDTAWPAGPMPLLPGTRWPSWAFLHFPAPSLLSPAAPSARFLLKAPPTQPQTHTTHLLRLRAQCSRPFLLASGGPTPSTEENTQTEQAPPCSRPAWPQGPRDPGTVCLGCRAFCPVPTHPSGSITDMGGSFPKRNLSPPRKDKQHLTMPALQPPRKQAFSRASTAGRRVYPALEPAPRPGAHLLREPLPPVNSLSAAPSPIGDQP